MSAHLNGTNGRGPGRPKKIGVSETENIAIRPDAKTPMSDLVKRAGGTKGFSPVPVDQHRWQAMNSTDPRARIWSWLTSHTVGHPDPQLRREWAVNEYGFDLHVEDIARDLKMDPAQVRYCWRSIVRAGIGRWGTKEEGDRRLYYCGDVPNSTEIWDEDGEEEANKQAKEKDCTILLPDSILRKTKGWGADKILELGRKWEAFGEEEWERNRGIERELAARVAAAQRFIISPLDDNLFARLGVNPHRQEHRKKGEGEQEAKDRRYSQFGVLLPALEAFARDLQERFVQTENRSVQTPKTDLHNPLIIIDKSKDREEKKPLRAGGFLAVVTEAPARPDGVFKDPPAENQKQNGHAADGWRSDLRDWLRENCPVTTALDDVMFERIAFWLSPETLGQFRTAALAVQNPRKWPVYESVAKQVAARGEIHERKPIGRLDRLAQEMREERTRGH